MGETKRPRGVIDPRLISSPVGSKRDERRARKFVEACARERGLLPENYPEIEDA